MMIYSRESKIMDKRYLKDIFNEFNREFFNGELPMPEFKIERLPQEEFGAYYRTDNTIRITNTYEFTGLDIKKIIIHEMVHIWQWVNGYWLDEHRGHFLDKAEEINLKTNYKYGIGRYTIVDGILKEKPTNFYFLIGRKKINNELFLSRIFKNSLNNFLDGDDYNITIEGIYEPSNKFNLFNELSLSKTILHIQPIPDIWYDDVINYMGKKVEIFDKNVC